MNERLRDLLHLVFMLLVSCFGGLILLAAQVLSASPWMTNTQTLSSLDADQGSPSVAWNPAEENYLMVWEQSVNAAESMIFGQLIDASGISVGSAFQISDNGTIRQTTPELAYDPGTNRFLVIWLHDNDDSGSDYWGRLIPAAGPSSGLQPFLIAQSGTSGTVDVFDCALADKSDNSNFFVVWLDNTSGISGRFIKADGSTSPAAFSVATATGLFEGLVLAWNEDEEEFLLAYSYSTNGDWGGEDDILATRLSSTGTVIGSEISVVNDTPDEFVSGLVSCRGEYMLALETAETTQLGTGHRVEAVHISGDGTVGSVTFLDYQDSDIFEPYPWPYSVVACNADGGETFVVWSRIESGTGWHSNGISGAVFDLEGRLDDSFLIYATIDDFDYVEPGLSFGDAGKGIVLWSSERPPDSTYFDLRGRLISNRIFSDGFEDGDTSSWPFP